jgi:hypothetical protein
MGLTILVTVSRSWSAWPTMRGVLANVRQRYPDAILVHGNCRRGDQDAAGMWRRLGGVDKPMDADWATCAPHCKPGHRRRNQHGEYCPTAGLRRDAEMVATAPDRVLAFLDPSSKTKGAFRTADMAERCGIPTARYVQGETSAR